MSTDEHRLTEFVLARTAEDEEMAKECAKVYPSPWDVNDRGYQASVKADAPHFWTVTEIDQAQYEGDGWPGDPLQHIARHNPARVLAECEAKRQIIVAAFVVAQKIDGEWGCCHTADQIRDEPLSTCYGPSVAAEFLKPLALPYSSHPDYLPGWRP